MSIYKSIFGGSIDINVASKLRLRQRLAEDSRVAPGDSVTVSETMGTHNFKRGDAFLNELGSRTPWARAWVAIDVRYDPTTPENQKVEWEYKETTYDWEEHKPAVYDYLRPWKEITPAKTVTHSVPISGYTKKMTSLSSDNDKAESLAKKVYVLGNHGYNEIITKENVHNPIQFSKNLHPDSFYANLGIDSDYGMNVQGALPGESQENPYLKPPAGITSVESSTEGPYGAIKRTNINFLVHNFNDFQNIYAPYFMRPGATIIVEWGWDTAHANNLYDPQTIIENDEDLRPFLFAPKGVLDTAAGDMEAIIGKVVNYDYSVDENGSYVCSVELVSDNAALIDYRLDDENAIRNLIIDNLGTIIINRAASILGHGFLRKDFTSDKILLTESETYARTFIAGLTGGGYFTSTPTSGGVAMGVYWKGYINMDDPVDESWRYGMFGGYFEGPQDKQIGPLVSEVDITSLSTPDGMNYQWQDDPTTDFDESENPPRALIVENDNNLYVSWGFFEEEMLNKYLATGQYKVGKTYGGFFNSAKSWVTYDNSLWERQLASDVFESDGKAYPFLLPKHWGNSYNTINHPDKFAEFDISLVYDAMPSLEVVEDEKMSEWRLMNPNATEEEEQMILNGYRQSMVEAFNASYADPDGPLAFKHDVGNLSLQDQYWDGVDHETPTDWIFNSSSGVDYDRNPYDPVSHLYDQDYLTMPQGMAESAKARGMIPFREIFVNVGMIKEAFQEYGNIQDALINILERLSDASLGVWNLAMISASRDNASLSIVDTHFYNSALDEDNVQYLDSLFTFHPYTKGSIVKEMNLNFTTPKNGIQNIIAIQNTPANFSLYPLTEQERDNNALRALHSYLPGKTNYPMSNANANQREGLNNIFFNHLPGLTKNQADKDAEKLKSKQFDKLTESKVLFEKNSNASNVKSQYKSLQTRASYIEKGEVDVLWSPVTQTEGGNIGSYNMFNTVLTEQLYEGLYDNKSFGMDLLPENNDNEAATSDASNLSWTQQHYLDNSAYSNWDDLRDAKLGGDYQDEPGEDYDPSMFHTNTLSDYFKYKIQGDFMRDKLSPAIPMINCTLTTYGISGILPGDAFTVTHLPNQYIARTYFTVTNIVQSVDSSGWYTTLNSQMRVKNRDFTYSKTNSSGFDMSKVFLSPTWFRRVQVSGQIETYFKNFQPDIQWSGGGVMVFKALGKKSGEFQNAVGTGNKEIDFLKFLWNKFIEKFNAPPRSEYGLITGQFRTDVKPTLSGDEPSYYYIVCLNKITIAIPAESKYWHEGGSNFMTSTVKDPWEDNYTAEGWSWMRENLRSYLGISNFAALRWDNVENTEDHLDLVDGQVPNATRFYKFLVFMRITFN